MAQTTESASSDETTTKEGVQIKGKDVILLNAPEVKLSPKTPLLTKAQDVAGAINELFQLDPGGGDSDKWVRPADWPVLPEPQNNQIIMLITTQWNAYPYESIYLYANKQDDTTQYFSGNQRAIIDWGDGYTDNVDLLSTEWYSSPGHYFYDLDTLKWNDGPVLDNGAHVFVITITLPDEAYFYHPGNCEVLDMHIGSEVKFWSGITNKNMLEHIKIFRENSDCPIFANNYVLNSVEVVPPLSVVTKNMFKYCANLIDIDLSECTEIQDESFSNCYRLRQVILPKVKSIKSNSFANCNSLKQITAPLLSTIENYAFSSCYSLENVDTPQLLNVENYAFVGCLNLLNVSHSENWTYGYYSFRDCYKYYNNPNKNHPDGSIN